MAKIICQLGFFRNYKSIAGFTLIELIIVVGILCVLSMLLIATVDPMAQFQKANDGRRKSDLGQIQKALEQYYQDNGRYPAHSTTAPTYRIVRLNGTTANWGQAFTPYINVLPKDPSSTKNYVYYFPSGGQAYYLYASLDRGSKDPQACSVIPCTNVPSGVKCGGTNNCNYGVSSPNVSP